MSPEVPNCNNVTSIPGVLADSGDDLQVSNDAKIDGCQLNCARFYHTERNSRFTVACSTDDGSDIENAKLHFDDINYYPNAKSIEVGGVFQETHLLTNGTTLFVSIDEVKPAHFISYSLSGTCQGSDINSTFVLLENVNGQKSFTDVDYIIFGLFLALSCFIGVGFAVYAYMKQRRAHEGPSRQDFLLASRSMHVIPLTLSLISSFMSAITLIGTPAEIYVYGTQYLIVGIGYFLFMPLAAHVLMPFFYNLRVTSVYEYLELRFSRSLRRVTAVVYIIHMTLYMAMVVYTPSIAMEAVTGLNMWVSALASSAICILYTSLGGLRSAVWTDVFQVFIMVAGLLAALIQGSIREGGLFTRAWHIAERGGRIEFFNFDPNPLLRHTFWTLVIGGTVNWAFTYCINQAQIQRALSAKTLKEAQWAYWLNVPGLVIFMFLPGLCGILLYARYQFCDPILSHRIEKRDQLLPLYVMDVLSEDLPGFPGLFIATLFSGALSTISSGLNGLGAVVESDFLQEMWFDRYKVSEKFASRVTRIITLVFGIITLLLILFIQQLPGILDVALALTSALGGPVFGVFLAGIYLPFLKWQPALIAVVLSLALNIWLTIGNIIAKPQNYNILQTSTESCLALNETLRSVQEAVPLDIDSLSDWEKFYSVSYMYYGIFGLLGTIAIALLLTPIFGCDDPRRFKEGWCNPTCVRMTQAVQAYCCRPKSSKKDDEKPEKDPLPYGFVMPLNIQPEAAHNPNEGTVEKTTTSF